MCMKDLNSPYQLAVDGSVSQFTFIDIDCGKLRLLPYVASCVCVCVYLRQTHKPFPSSRPFKTLEIRASENTQGIQTQVDINL
jgi:hypothetical protein